MSDELIDMHNRISTEELDRLVRHPLKSVRADMICRRSWDILRKNEK